MNGERGWPPPPKRSRHETQKEEKEQGDCEEIAVTQITSVVGRTTTAAA